MGPSRRMQAASLALLIACALLAAPALAAAAASPLDRATAAVFPIVAKGQRIGSGVLVAPDLVLTAAHVVHAADTEYLLDGVQLLPVEIVATDEGRDLALLHVRLPARATPIEWGDSTKLARGDDVVVLGYPLGMSEVSLTKGVVSSPRQMYAGSAYIQTDAAINPGNSGGALVDKDGRLVGINVAKIAGVDVGGIGFAVPGSDAFAFVREYAAISQPAPPPGPAARWWIAGIGGLVVLVLGAGFVFARSRAEEAPIDLDEPGSDGRATDRRLFRVTGPASAVTLDLRLPAVAGSARNADILLREPGVAEYQVRFMPGPGEGVTALSLVGDGGMYCGDACVLEAVLEPGASVRVGATVVTLLARETDGTRD